MATSTTVSRLVLHRLKTLRCRTFLHELSSPQFRSLSNLPPSTQLASSISQTTHENRLKSCCKPGSFVAGLPNSTTPVSLFAHPRFGYRYATPVTVSIRNFSSQTPQKKQIQAAKLVVVRNPFNIIRDLLYSWLIKVYFDPDFSLYEFADGAKKVRVVNNYLRHFAEYNIHCNSMFLCKILIIESFIILTQSWEQCKAK